MVPEVMLLLEGRGLIEKCVEVNQRYSKRTDILTTGEVYQKLDTAQ
jgi:hypothetical protein